VRALFTYGADVPLSRVIAEHRRWLWPVGVLLAINVAVLLGVVLPLRQTVANGAARAQASEQSLRAAKADLQNAEATRDGQSQASMDLDKFYAEVLPANMTVARRMTHVKLAQLARTRGVDFQSGATTQESVRDSTLERLHVTYSLSGDWDDIRQFIYEIETGPDFVVIDNVQLAEGAQNAGLSLTLDLSTYYRVVDGR
jgi:Tfp pilus assembly protein PilO